MFEKCCKHSINISYINLRLPNSEKLLIVEKRACFLDLKKSEFSKYRVSFKVHARKNVWTTVSLTIMSENNVVSFISKIRKKNNIRHMNIKKYI